MATSKQKAKERSKVQHDDEPDKSNGDGGWEDRSTERAPWLKKDEKAVVSGYLMGRHSWGQGKEKRYYYQLKLTSKATGVSKDADGDPEEVDLDKGDMVNVDETFSLNKDLAPLTDDGGKYEVRLIFGVPERDRKGKPKFWPIKVQSRTIKAPTRTPRDFSEALDRKGRKDEDREPGADDDIPF